MKLWTRSRKRALSFHVACSYDSRENRDRACTEAKPNRLPLVEHATFEWNERDREWLKRATRHSFFSQKKRVSFPHPLFVVSLAFADNHFHIYVCDDLHVVAHHVRYCYFSSQLHHRLHADKNTFILLLSFSLTHADTHRDNLSSFLTFTYPLLIKYTFTNVTVLLCFSLFLPVSRFHLVHSSLPFVSLSTSLNPLSFYPPLPADFSSQLLLCTRWKLIKVFSDNRSASSLSPALARRL